LNVTNLSRFNNINIVKYQPRIDGDFFPANFTELYQTTSPIPSISGINTHEAIFYSLFGFQFSRFTPMGITAEDWPTFLESNFTSFVINDVVDEGLFGEQAAAAASDVIAYYTADKPSDYATNYSYWITQYTQIISDIMFDIPILWTSQAKLENGWPTYMYLDTHYNEILFDNEYVTNPPVKGTFHTNEYPYQFGVFVFAEFNFTEPELQMQTNIISTIGNFAKTQNPSTSDLTWPQISSSHPTGHLLLQPNATFNPSPLMADRLAFWNNVTAKYPFNIVLRTVDWPRTFPFP